MCTNSLISTNVNVKHSLITVKNRGGLCFPSEDVFDISLTCENIFRQTVITSKTGETNALNNYEAHKVVHEILKVYLNKIIFSNVLPHMTDTEPENNHVVLLIKAIAETYLQVRYCYAAKQFTVNFHVNKKSASRQTLSKLIIFKGH